MKMLLIGLGALLLMVLPAGAADAPVAKAKITLAANRWEMTVRPDGSVLLRRDLGNHTLMVMAAAPAGTVDFGRVRGALEDDWAAATPGQKAGPLTGAIRPAGKESSPMKPVHRVAIWNHLIDQLDANWTTAEATPENTTITMPFFQKEVRKHPLKIAAP